MTNASSEGLFALPAPASVPAVGLRTSATQEIWRIPVILVSYADSLIHYSASDFEKLLFDATHSTPTGSAYDYYRWASGGRFTLQGRVVATVQLTETRSYYGANAWGMNAQGTPRNSYGMVRDAIRQVPSSVDWSEFDLDRDGFVDMLWVIHVGLGGEATQSERDNPWSVTSRMSYGWRTGTPYITDDPVPGSTQFMRIDRFTVLPELSPFDRRSISEIGVYCHEFGHALGLPDLYDTTSPTNVGPGNWSLMSSGAWGTDGSSPKYPAHFDAWSLQFLGWDRTLRPARDTTIVLPPLESGRDIVDWWYQGESSTEHFLIENRQRIGFDRNLPAEGLLVYHVDEAVIGGRLRTNTINSGPSPGLWLVEADGDSDLVVGRNRGDGNDPFPGNMNRTAIDDDTRPSTRSFSNAATQIALTATERIGQTVRFRLQVRAPGWQAPQDYSGPIYKPLDTYSFARVSAVDDRGVAHVVGSETRAGVPQIMLREGNDGWTAPEQVSESSRAALDPTLTTLPGGGIAVVWSDYREGRPQLYGRARIGGVWTPERKITSLPGDCLNPAIIADRNGTISLAFQQILAGIPQIYFLRYTAKGPAEIPIPVTGTIGELPGSPAVAVGNGVTYVMWGDRFTDPQRLYLSRVHPDSGAKARVLLTPFSTYSQVGLSALVDRNGLMHLVWQVSGPGTSQLYYMTRPGSTETLLESQGNLLQNPTLSIDDAGGLHLVFERSEGSLMQVRYRGWKPALGWDARSTDLTYPDAFDTGRPQPLPIAPDNLTIAFNQFHEDGAHFVVRRRGQDPAEGLDLPAEPQILAPTVFVGPTPLRSGADLRIEMPIAESIVAPRMEIFDLAGRKLAAVELRRLGDAWSARIPGATTRQWASGIYFARARDGATAAARIVVLR